MLEIAELTLDRRPTAVQVAEPLGLARDQRVQPIGAIHLATAQQMDVAEFHTYCEHLQKWSGTLGFPVVEPQVQQGMLGVEPPNPPRRLRRAPRARRGGRGLAARPR